MYCPLESGGGFDALLLAVGSDRARWLVPHKYFVHGRALAEEETARRLAVAVHRAEPYRLVGTLGRGGESSE